jgi:hypothetical protein
MRQSAVAALVLGTAACAGAPRVGPMLAPPPEPGDIDLSFFMVGDAGGPVPEGEPVLRALEQDLAVVTGRAVVLYLGDNIYPAGLPPEDRRERAEAQRRLDERLDAVTRHERAEGILIGGNHDWTFAFDGGWAAIRRQGEHAAERTGGRVVMLPAGGCPGPAVRDYGETIRLIALDTEWWLYNGEKPAHPDSSCPADSEEEVVDSLAGAIAGAQGRRVLVIGHHPIESAGNHGGYFSVLQHLFPLRDLKPWLWIPMPLLGSIYPLARRYGVSQEDVGGFRNRRLREALRDTFEAEPPLLYASGHDHNLQVIEDVGARYQIVSGAGYYGHTSHTAWLDNTVYAARASGYVRVDVLLDGRIRLGVIEVDALGNRNERFSMFLGVER